ncbi:MAG: RsmE family RNA methyltransferase [Patescibacteria group bacterium]
MHRFFIEQKLQKGERVIKNEPLASRFSRVLRIRSEEIIVFFNGDGFDYVARVISISKNEVRAEILEQKKNERELNAMIVVCQGVVRKERMEWAFEKGTEVGVSEFMPITTERSITKNLNSARIVKIITEATEQSGRAILPRYLGVVSFFDAIAQCAREGGFGILFDISHASEVSFTELSALVRLHHMKKIYIFIGPEGGFSKNEIQRAEEMGIKIVHLYPTILRSETAAVVFPALIASCVFK